MTTQFDQIYHGAGRNAGKIRVAGSGVAWKGDGAESDNQESSLIALKADEIKWAQWLRVARGFQLRIGLKDHQKETFDGFEREDHDKLTSILKQHFGVTLESREISFKGWNWGVTDFQGDTLAFQVSNKTSFEIPLSKVANSNIAGRTEVSLEFAPTPGKPSKRAPDEMMEIRFYVPGTHTKERGSDAGDQEGDEDEDEEQSAAQAFHDLVQEKAEIGQVTGDIVLSFEEVLVLTPRGRYDMDMFKDFLRLRGKTYDYKILYSNIARLFLLPKDDQNVNFILSLNNPIRQGQTRYPYLVMQFSRDEEITAELNMTEEEVSQYDRLKKSYEDPTFEVVSSVFRALVKKKIIGAGSFQSKSGQPGVKTNLKATAGDLFLLERYIFFVSKQSVLLELSDLHQVVFSRVGASVGAASGRTFDLKVVTKSGPEYTFTSVPKEEYEPMDAFFKTKNVRVKNEMVPDADLLLAAAGVDEDEDEEMQSVDSSDDDAPKVRAGGGDDSSEEDEDFHASSSDTGGSGTETDSNDSGGAATASDASGDIEFTKAKKAKTKKKKKSDVGATAAGESASANAGVDKPKKKAKKSKTKREDSGDAMDVDGEEPATKPKPKPKPKPKAKPNLKETEADSDEPAKKKAKLSSD